MINRLIETVRGASLIVKLIGVLAVVAIIITAGLFAARHSVEASFWQHGKGERHHGERADYDRANKHKRHTYGNNLNAIDVDDVSSLVISDKRFMRHGGVKSVRYAVGAAQNVDTAAGTFDLMLRDGSGTLSFAIDDNTRVFINGSEGMSGLDADSLVTVIERRDLDGWAGRLGNGFGIFSDGGTVKTETRYLSDGGVKTVARAVGTPQNINASAGTFDLMLRDGSSVMSFEVGSNAEALVLGLNAEETVTVVQTTNIDGSTDVQIMAGSEHSRDKDRTSGYSRSSGDHDYDGDGKRQGKRHN